MIPLPVLANVLLPQLDSVTCAHKKTLFRAHVAVQSEHMHIQIRGSACFMLGASVRGCALHIALVNTCTFSVNVSCLMRLRLQGAFDINIYLHIFGYLCVCLK